MMPVSSVLKKTTKLELLDRIVATLRNNRSLFERENDYYSRGYRDCIDDSINVIREYAGLPHVEEESG